MKLKKTIIGLGIALTLGGGGIAGEFALNKDVKVGSRTLTERNYKLERANILGRINSKQSNMFFWTNDGKEWLDVVARELKNCININNRIDQSAISKLGDDFFSEIGNQILLNCTN